MLIVKRLFLIYLLFFALNQAYAQTVNYSVTGNLAHLTGQQQKLRVFLIRPETGGFKVDSVNLEKGIFKFTGQVNAPVRVTLILDHSGQGLHSRQGDLIDFYLENTPVVIHGADSIANAIVKGGPVNNESAKFLLVQRVILDSIHVLTAQVQASSAALQKEPAFQQSVENKYNSIIASNKKLICRYIKQNPTSLAGFDQLYNAYESDADASKAAEAYDALDNSLKITKKGKELGQLINSGRLTQIGAVAPDFSQADTAGHQIRLSSLRGKYVLIDFWASWCRPCRQENPNVVRVYNNYHNKNFTILGVSLDQPQGKNQWIAAIKEDHLSWAEVSDLKFWSNDVAKLYGVRSIPQNFLLDPAGKIIASNLKGEELDSFLAKLLK